MGRTDVDAMLAEMTPAQMLGWLRFYRLHPWGEERSDLRHASLMALMYNLLRRKGPAKRVRDFLPRWAGRPRQTADQMISMLRAAAAVGAHKTKDGG